jgi:DNA (cytosine-5)-methyltransferase 1
MYVVRPLLLDLFCGAGGAAMGYHRAGFDVVGIDNRPQRHYPFRFILGDALNPPVDLSRFDAIHASPPCQAFTKARVIRGRAHFDLLTPSRLLLEMIGVPWVIENVPGAPMRKDYMLCGSMFGLHDGDLGLIRHRWFELYDASAAGLVMQCRHLPQTVSVFGHGGRIYPGKASWERVMGIDWMTRDELAQAIPPAYTEFIGRQLLRAI